MFLMIYSNSYYLSDPIYKHMLDNVAETQRQRVYLSKLSKGEQNFIIQNKQGVEINDMFVCCSKSCFKCRYLQDRVRELQAKIKRLVKLIDPHLITRFQRTAKIHNKPNILNEEENSHKKHNKDIDGQKFKIVKIKYSQAEEFLEREKQFIHRFSNKSQSSDNLRNKKSNSSFKRQGNNGSPNHKNEQTVRITEKEQINQVRIYQDEMMAQIQPEQQMPSFQPFQPNNNQQIKADNNQLSIIQFKNGPERMKSLIIEEEQADEIQYLLNQNIPRMNEKMNYENMFTLNKSQSKSQYSNMSSSQSEAIYKTNMRTSKLMAKLNKKK